MATIAPMLLQYRPLTAEEYNKTGCELYCNRQYLSALNCFNQAISLNPNVYTFYYNRSTCFIRLSLYDNALQDSRKCMQLEPNHVGAYLYAGLLVADVYTMKKEDFTRCFELANYAQHAWTSNNLDSCLNSIEKMLMILPQKFQFKVIKLKLLSAMKKYKAAESVVNELLLVNNQFSIGYRIRGRLRFYDGDFANAIADFETAVQLSPKCLNLVKPIMDNAKRGLAKKQASEAITCDDLNKAFDLYSDALKIDPTNNEENSKLYFNRSIVVAKLGNISDAIHDCSKAIELDSQYLKAYLRRAKLYRDLKLFEKSIRDYAKVVQLEPTNEEFMELFEATMSEAEEWDKAAASDDTGIDSTSNNTENLQSNVTPAVIEQFEATTNKWVAAPGDGIGLDSSSSKSEDLPSSVTETLVEHFEDTRSEWVAAAGDGTQLDALPNTSANSQSNVAEAVIEQFEATTNKWIEWNENVTEVHSLSGNSLPAVVIEEEGVNEAKL